MTKGSIIKFGRVRFRVKKLVLTHDTKPDYNPVEALRRAGHLTESEAQRWNAERDERRRASNPQLTLPEVNSAESPHESFEMPQGDFSEELSGEVEAADTL